MTKEHKHTIVCVLGKSGVGKDTIADILAEELSLYKVVSITNRPRRFGYETTHVFVSDEFYDKIPQHYKLAETTYGGYKYCAIDDIYRDSIYVIDVDGLEYLKTFCGERYNIITLLIKRENNSVTKDRTARDPPFPDDDSFDIVFENNYESKKELRKNVPELIKKIRNYYDIGIDNTE